MLAAVAHARAEAKPGQRAAGDRVIAAQRRRLLRLQRDLLAQRIQRGGTGFGHFRIDVGICAVDAEVARDVPAPFQLEAACFVLALLDRIRGRSEEHTSELQSLMRISYAVLCLKKKKYRKYNCV